MDLEIKVFERSQGDWALAVVHGDSVLDWAAFSTAIDAYAAANMIASAIIGGTSTEKPRLSFNALFAETAASDELPF